MRLTEDELDQVASAYHEACRKKRGEKLALYAAAETVPELTALQAAPVDWADAVAAVIADILHARCKVDHECGLSVIMDGTCFVCGNQVNK